MTVARGTMTRRKKKNVKLDLDEMDWVYNWNPEKIPIESHVIRQHDYPSYQNQFTGFSWNDPLFRYHHDFLQTNGLRSQTSLKSYNEIRKEILQ